MLKIYMPQEYIYDESQRYTRVPHCFGMEYSGDPDKFGNRVVWAVADGTADDLADRVVDYREYDWSQAATLCFGHDEESLVHSGKIKPHHDLVHIPQVSVSMHMDQAMAIILAWYVSVVSDANREARVADNLAKIREMRKAKRQEWLNNSVERHPDKYLDKEVKV